MLSFIFDYFFERENLNLITFFAKFLSNKKFRFLNATETNMNPRNINESPQPEPVMHHPSEEIELTNRAKFRKWKGKNQFCCGGLCMTSVWKLDAPT
jgi:hypothetical protein